MNNEFYYHLLFITFIYYFQKLHDLEYENFTNINTNSYKYLHIKWIFRVCANQVALV